MSVTSTTYGNRRGLLDIRVVEARNLRSHHTFSKMDPYAKLKVGAFEVHQTNILKKGGVTPKWDSKANPIAVQNVDGDLLTVEIWDKDTWSADDLVGKSTLQIASLAGNGVVDRWYTVSPQGEIRLRTAFTPSEQPSVQPTPTEPVYAPQAASAPTYAPPAVPAQPAYAPPQAQAVPAAQPTAPAFAPPQAQSAYAAAQPQAPTYAQPAYAPVQAQAILAQPAYAPVQPQYAQPQYVQQPPPQYVQQPPPQYVQQPPPQYVQAPQRQVVVVGGGGHHGGGYRYEHGGYEGGHGYDHGRRRGYGHGGGHGYGGHY